MCLRSLVGVIRIDIVRHDKEWEESWRVQWAVGSGQSILRWFRYMERMDEQRIHRKIYIFFYFIRHDCY